MLRAYTFTYTDGTRRKCDTHSRGSSHGYSIRRCSGSVTRIAMGSLLTSRMQLGGGGRAGTTGELLFYTAKVIYHKFRQIHTERLIKRFIIGAAADRRARPPIIISGISCQRVRVPTFARDTLIARWTRIFHGRTRSQFQLVPQKPHVAVSLFALRPVFRFPRFKRSSPRCAWLVLFLSVWRTVDLWRIFYFNKYTNTCAYVAYVLPKQLYLISKTALIFTAWDVE